MEKQFVPFEFAVKLKELGFDEPVLGWFNGSKELEYENRYGARNFIDAPLWQQAFDFFREKYGLLCEPKKYVGFYFDIEKIVHNRAETELVEGTLSFDTYEQARIACFEKLVELTSNS